ncbi:MAG TPA: FecR domain-containing protein [Candidatus Dormibacteraeota bacterium]|nr:FecR domain-containing protein [Candidatus Dormibacteraeota bacterium]
MKDEKFDRLLLSIRNEEVDQKAVDKAGERVWNAIAGASPTVDLNSHTLRSCADFQALIPSYVEKELAPARAMLFEDHVHACVACRHALERARQGELQPVWRLETKRSTSWAWRLAMGAAAVGVVALVTFAYSNGLLPGQHPVRAAVQTVDGSLYAMVDGETRVIPAGYELRNGDRIRTAKGSTAEVRLLDGSLVEMAERSDLSVSREWKGTTIHLDGGQVIVQAAKQRTGRLYVATEDGLVSVKGTIFSVRRGTKGSRVAVVEGVVRVNFGDNTTDLRAGDEATSSAALSKVPVQDEVAWSKNSAKYLALLGDFAILQKQIAAIPGPGLRYSSELLPYVPDHTVVYAAIPNLANTLGEARRLFEDRMRQSPDLRNWFRQQEKGNGPKLEDVLDQVKSFSGYLGDEVVFAVGKDGANYSAPVVLAKVRQPGLEGFLQKEGKRLSTNSAEVALQTVRDPWSVTPAPGHPLLVYVSNDLMIATSDLPQLQLAVRRSQQGGSSQFVGTPFYQQIAHSYEQGAEWLFSADMEQIVSHNVPANNNDVPPGIGDVRYLTMEHREVGGKTESHADLTFASERQGVASWLAAPGSMGSLEFVSPDASMVTSAVIKNPRNIMEEVFKMIGSGDPNFTEHLAEFESKAGVNVLDDIAAPLGGEVTMAFDGPMVPTPRWKLIFEVNDPATLQSTIEKLIDDLNREANNHGHSLQVTKKEVGSRTYFVISSPSQPNVEVDYTFVDSYLIAAPDLGTIARAIQSREAGYSLTHSPKFQALLPSDGYTNFSAIFYHNIGPVVGPLAEQLKASGALTPKQRQSVDALTANSAPGLIYAYGEPDRIVVASNTGFMGFDLGTLLTMGHNGPFLPQMFLGQTISHPNEQTQ